MRRSEKSRFVEVYLIPEKGLAELHCECVEGEE